MSDDGPTEADRAKAAEIIPRHRGLCDFDWYTGPNGPGCICGADRERDAIAAALAAERRDALAAQETLRRVRKVVDDWSSTAADDPGQAAYTAMRAVARALGDPL